MVSIPLWRQPLLGHVAGEYRLRRNAVFSGLTEGRPLWLADRMGPSWKMFGRGERTIGCALEREGTPDDSGHDTEDVGNWGPVSSSSWIRDPAPWRATPPTTVIRLCPGHG